MTEVVVERPEMAEYGVDAADWHGLPWSWAIERLASNRILEVDPERAFGIIEREDDFANRATRWRFVS